MRYLYQGSFALFFSAGLVASTFAADKDEKSKKPEAKPASSHDYVSVGEVSGVLAKAPEGNKLTFRVTQLTLQRGGAAKAMGRGRGTPTLKESDFDLEMTPDVIIRLLKLPPKKDEKGNKLAYTIEELQALKGKLNLRGYEAKSEDLKANQIVTVHLVRMKGHDTADAKPYVNRVYIEGEAAGLPSRKADEKKPEKKN